MEMENNLVVTKIEIYFIRTPKTIVNVLGSFVMFINLTEINYGFMIKYQNKNVYHILSEAGRGIQINSYCCS